MFTFEETAAAAEALGYQLTIAHDPAAGAHAVTLVLSPETVYGTFVSLNDPANADEDSGDAVAAANTEALMGEVNTLLDRAGAKARVLEMAQRQLAES